MNIKISPFAIGAQGRSTGGPPARRLETNADAFRLAALVAVLGAALGFMPLSAHGAAAGALAVDDSIITAKIKTALVQEPSARPRDVKVKTSHGVVRLSGIVDSEEAKQRVEVIAGTTEGVTEVRNEIKVRAGARGT